VTCGFCLPLQHKAFCLDCRPYRTKVSLPISERIIGVRLLAPKAGTSTRLHSKFVIPVGKAADPALTTGDGRTPVRFLFEMDGYSSPCHPSYDTTRQRVPSSKPDTIGHRTTPFGSNVCQKSAGIRSICSYSLATRGGTIGGFGNLDCLLKVYVLLFPLPGLHFRHLVCRPWVITVLI
jgi:hypothetical protein